MQDDDEEHDDDENDDDNHNNLMVRRRRHLSVARDIIMGDYHNTMMATGDSLEDSLSTAGALLVMLKTSFV